MAMSHSALMGMSSEPRSGIVAVNRSFYIVMEKNDFSDIKAAVIRKLNSNIYQHYPDAGGILLGYHDIKLKKSTSEITDTALLHPVFIKARFFLFKPVVGSELQCIVKKREEGWVTCEALGIFKVQVVNPPSYSEAAFVGQRVLVKVDAVEQSAWQEPKILASLVENDHSNSPFIEYVDNFDTNEFVSSAESDMFDYENIYNRRERRSNALVTQYSTSSEVENLIPQQVSKKRKSVAGNAVGQGAGDSSSPVERKIKITTKASSAHFEVSESESVFKKTRHIAKSLVDSETSSLPTSQSSTSEPNVVGLDFHHNHQPFTVGKIGQIPIVESLVEIIKMCRVNVGKLEPLQLIKPCKVMIERKSVTSCVEQVVRCQHGLGRLRMHIKTSKQRIENARMLRLFKDWSQVDIASPIKEQNLLTDNSELSDWDETVQTFLASLTSNT